MRVSLSGTQDRITLTLLISYSESLWHVVVVVSVNSVAAEFEDGAWFASNAMGS